MTARKIQCEGVSSVKGPKTSRQPLYTEQQAEARHKPKESLLEEVNHLPKKEAEHWDHDRSQYPGHSRPS